MIAGLLIFLSFVRLGFNLAVGVEAFLVDLATLSTKFDWLITSVSLPSFRGAICLTRMYAFRSGS